MKEKKLIASLLGDCELRFGDIKVVENTRRASKNWLLLAYLICNRDRVIEPEEITNRLWDDENDERTKGALKTTIWRVRQLIQPISEALGQELIIRKGNAYGWNPDIPVEVDTEQFEMLYRTACQAEDEETGLQALREALPLYKGEFLKKFSTEGWVEPLTAYYYNLYLDAVLKTLSLLQMGIDAQEIADLCRATLSISPYDEMLYQYLMRAQMEMQEYQQADETYVMLQELLFTNLGVMPSEESQAIHSEIRAHINDRFLTADMLQEQLREKNPLPGAILCDFPVFRLFYQAEARSASRRGDAIHVAVLSVASADGSELSELRLERVMEQLRGKLQNGLRRGDIIARCSASQFVALLLQANFENSGMVCERVVNSFKQAYPRSPARIHYTVLPLEPLQTNRDPQESGEMKFWTEK